MVLTKELEEELKRLYVEYFESLFQADVEKYESFFVDNFIQIGTTLEEVWFSKSESGKYLAAHVGPVAGKIDFRNRDIRIGSVDNLILITEQADCFVNIDGIWVFYDKARTTSLMQKTASGWKFVQQHISFPDSRTEEGQTVALEKIKAENIQLRDAVKRRTVELENMNRELENVILKLKSTQAQLIQSEKLASLGELTAGIAHEIQNPLNFVNNFSEVSAELVREIQDERSKTIDRRNEILVDEILGEIEANLEKIRHHGNRAGSIVKGMLGHSRKSEGKKELTDISQLADECLRISFHGFRAKDKTFNAYYKTDFETNLPKIRAVPQEIGRLLLNLINNAFYAVGEKAKAGVKDFIPEVIVSTKKNSEGILIIVKDNGLGIPDSIKDRIFQPFFTTKPAGEGSGLGLSLSHDIVKAHGGELKMESEVGNGTSFLVQIPF